MTRGERLLLATSAFAITVAIAALAGHQRRIEAMETAVFELARNQAAMGVVR